MIPIEQLLLGAAILLLLGIMASQASSRLGVPALLLFLLTGMLAGSEGLGGIYFDDAWLAQSLGVVALALILFAGGLDTELLVSAFLILVARPLSVFVSLAFFRMPIREKTLVAWVGLRGAAPIILATFPLVGGVPQADTLFNLVFFVVLTSVLIQGTSIAWVARGLGVDAPTTTRTRSPIEFESIANTGSALVEVSIPPTSPVVGKQLVDVHLPREALISLLQREDQFIVPRGSTILEAGDKLSVLADNRVQEQVRGIVEGTPSA